MNLTKRLPNFRIPKIKIQQIDLFEFAIEYAMHLHRVLEKHILISPKTSQSVRIHAQFSDGKILKTGWKILIDKKDTQIRLYVYRNARFRKPDAS
jgi:2-phospho-L-lactate transferase/gluconeogenesis factor (CofD/UPF0052 family)